MIRLSLLLASVCVLASPLSVSAADAEPARSKPVAGSDLKVVRDAQTGRLRAPTAQEAAKLSAAEPADADAEIEIRVARNGMKSARLPASMLISVEARRDADGVIRTRHDRAALDTASSSSLPTE